MTLYELMDELIKRHYTLDLSIEKFGEWYEVTVNRSATWREYELEDALFNALDNLVHQAGAE